jgi:arsenate reductase
MMITIYHKNTCSTSRKVLNMLKEAGQEVSIVLYMETPPSAKELKVLLAKLGLPAKELVRRKEALFKERFEGKEYSEKEWIRILAENSSLIERPIVVKGKRAIIARPPESVTDFLSF